MSTDLERKYREEIEKWISQLDGKAPTTQQVIELFGDLGASSIREFCDSFGETSAHLGMMVKGLVMVYDQISAHSENTQLVLEDEIVEQLRVASEALLMHVNTDGLDIQMFKVPDRDKLN